MKKNHAIASLALFLVGSNALGQGASTLQGRVFLEGRTDHSGSSVVGAFQAQTLGTSLSWLGLALLLIGLLRAPRRWKGLASLLALAGAGIGWAALQTLSSANGSYALSPEGGGVFSPGVYQVDYRHSGFLPESRRVRLTGQEAAAVSLEDVTLLRACTVFPANNPWNTDISQAPLHPNSDAYIQFIGASGHVHPDFGTVWEGAPIGIPYSLVPASQPKLNVAFLYSDQSDHQGYPIPAVPLIEGGPQSTGDRHILMLDLESCLLYELYWAWPPGVGENPYQDRWYAGSGAIFDLKSNDLRPDTWTSADAAGLPIYPGLVRYDEVVEQGHIDHALRFTVHDTQHGYIHPATHLASDNTDPSAPPMGLRLRMKATYDCGAYSTEAQVVCTALKKYGMFVADNGSDWYISGAPDPRWDDERLGDLKQIPGSAFEAVDTGPILTYP